jgi:hypothetical protein
MHAIDIKIPTAPKIVYHNEMDHVDLTDIEFCGGYVFVAMDNLFMKEKGRVVVFHSFSSSQPMAVRYNITGELYFLPSTRHTPCYFSLESKNSPTNKTRSEITCSELPARHWCRFTNSR